MTGFRDSFAKTPVQKERLRQIGELADRFAAKAHIADENHSFAYEHIAALKEMRYPAYTVPREYGGFGVSLYEFLLYQERLAQGDAAIALGIGWHLCVTSELASQKLWKESQLTLLLKEIAEKGALINKAASEAGTGSPSRGGKPQTIAAKHGDGYRLTGRKTFTTLSPVLDYFIVTATLEETGEVAEFIIPRDTAGVSIDPTWKMVGMRGTASHDLVMDGVVLPKEGLALVFDGKKHGGPNPYLLHIPACYLGIALAARQEALKFASTYQPNSLNHPIIHTPNVQLLLGQIDLELTAARHFMYSVAERWDEDEEAHAYLAADLAAVKFTAVQAAMSAVDKAMRIVGAHSLALSNPLQRMYRDVRFGLHNPPMDDTTIRMLAQRAIAEVAKEE